MSPPAAAKDQHAAKDAEGEPLLDMQAHLISVKSRRRAK
jgi:hypothetical protein